MGDSSTSQSDSGNVSIVQRDLEADETNYRVASTYWKIAYHPKDSEQALPLGFKFPYISVVQKDLQTPRMGRPEDRQVRKDT